MILFHMFLISLHWSSLLHEYSPNATFLNFPSNFEQYNFWIIMITPMFLIVCFIGKVLRSGMAYYAKFILRLTLAILFYEATFYGVTFLLGSLLDSLYFRMSCFIYSASFLLIVDMYETRASLTAYRLTRLSIEEQQNGGHTVLEQLDPHDYGSLRTEMDKSECWAHILSAIYLFSYYALHVVYYQYLCTSEYKLCNALSTGVGMITALFFYYLHGMPNSPHIYGTIQV